MNFNNYATCQNKSIACSNRTKSYLNTYKSFYRLTFNKLQPEFKIADKFVNKLPLKIFFLQIKKIKYSNLQIGKNNPKIYFYNKKCVDFIIRNNSKKFTFQLKFILV